MPIWSNARGASLDHTVEITLLDAGHEVYPFSLRVCVDRATWLGRVAEHDQVTMASDLDARTAVTRARDVPIKVP
jgi:hypothetical protein